jgi:hypothetical protein
MNGNVVKVWNMFIRRKIIGTSSKQEEVYYLFLYSAEIMDQWMTHSALRSLIFCEVLQPILSDT